MTTALATADPFTANLITQALLVRGDAEGLLGLVLQFHRLPDDAQTTIVQHGNNLYCPLRQASTHQTQDGPRNVLTIVRRSGDTKLTYLVLDLLRHGSVELRRQAAECLLDLARMVTAELYPPDATPAVYPAKDAHYLQEAVEQSVQLYRHHEQTNVLLALATLMPRPLLHTGNSLDDWHHPSVVAMRRLLAAADNPTILRATLPLLLRAPLTEATLSCLQHADADGSIGHVLCCWHLLRIGPLCVELKQLNPVPMQSLVPRRIIAWPANQTRGLPDWIMALPMDQADQAEALARLQSANDHMTRLTALRRLISLARSSNSSDGIIDDLIPPFCFDPHPAIAAIALRHLICRRWSGLAKLSLKLVNSNHPRVSQLAAKNLTPVGFTRFWQAWPRLDPHQRLAAGRALMKLDPKFHHQLSQRLDSGNLDQQLRALAIISDLNQGLLFEAALLVLKNDPNVKIASATIKALATVKTEPARQAIEQALDHHDARVRANAIEALDQCSAARYVDRLVTLATREDNRPRANAIQALLDVRLSEALRALGTMLEDTRPKHRVSGLWLVEYAGLLPMARRVAEMSISDPDSSIKKRAGRIVQTLINSMQSGEGTQSTSTSHSLAKQ